MSGPFSCVIPALCSVWPRGHPEQKRVEVSSNRPILRGLPPYTHPLLLSPPHVRTCCCVCVACVSSAAATDPPAAADALQSSNGFRVEGFPSHRRLWPLQPSRGRVQLVPQLRRHAESVQRRVLHRPPGVLPLQAGPAAPALRVPPQQLLQAAIPQPHRPLGERLRAQPLWIIQVPSKCLWLFRKGLQGEGVLHPGVGVRQRSGAPEQLCHWGKRSTAVKCVYDPRCWAEVMLLLTHGDALHTHVRFVSTRHLKSGCKHMFRYFYIGTKTMSTRPCLRGFADAADQLDAFQLSSCWVNICSSWTVCCICVSGSYYRWSTRYGDYTISIHIWGLGL